MITDPACVTAVGGLVSCVVYLFKKTQVLRDEIAEMLKKEAERERERIARYQQKIQELERKALENPFKA